MNPIVPERKVASLCQLETEMESSSSFLARVEEEEEEAEEDDDEGEEEPIKPLSTAFLASTPASLFSTPGATETVMCGADSFVTLGSNAKTSRRRLISAISSSSSPSSSSTTTATATACALPSSATPVARSRGAGEPRRGARVAIVSASGLNASVRWSAETFAWDGGALPSAKRNVFFFLKRREEEKVEKREKEKN